MYTTGELRAMTTPELLIEFRKSIGDTVESVRRTAMIYRELVDRSVDMSEWDNPLLRLMLPVAKGTLLPEIVVKFGGYRTLIDVVSTLSVPDQKKLTGDTKMEVLTSANAPKARSVFPMRMSPIEIYRVFGEGRIRTVDEQRALLAKSAPADGRASAGGRGKPIGVIEWPVLTPIQRKEMLATVARRKTTTVEYVLSLLIKAKAITEASPSTVRNRAQTTAHSTHASM